MELQWHDADGGGWVEDRDEPVGTAGVGRPAMVDVAIMFSIDH